MCAILVFDSFRCHITDHDKERLAACHTDLVVIPDGMTTPIQLLDVRLNKPILDRICAAYNDWFGEQAVMLAHLPQKATLKDIARRAHGAWKALPQAVATHALKNVAFLMSWMGLRMTFCGRWTVNMS